MELNKKSLLSDTSPTHFDAFFPAHWLLTLADNLSPRLSLLFGTDFQNIEHMFTTIISKYEHFAPTIKYLPCYFNCHNIYFMQKPKQNSSHDMHSIPFSLLKQWTYYPQSSYSILVRNKLTDCVEQ